MANVNNGILIGYSDLFDDEPMALEHYLIGLNQEYLKKSLLHLLGPFMDGNEYNLQLLLRKFFSEPNREFAISIFNKLLSISDAGKKEISIINPYSILTIFELIYNNKNTDEAVFGYEAEICIFKAILVVNQSQNINQQKSYPLIELGMLPQSIFTISYPSSDIINGNLVIILITQLVKTLTLLDFLSDGPKGKLLLDKYLKEFGFNELEDYIRILSSFLTHCVHNIYTHKTCDFIINEDNEYSTYCRFIDNLILLGQETVFEEDFTTLKRSPIIKLSEGHYQIIYLPFVLEMVFKGMYFKLSEINKRFLGDNMPLIKDFRGVFCYEFSEKTLLYKTLFEIYRARYKCFSGEEMESSGLIGGSDFYMRSGNNVFLFENKDVMIDKKIKVSYDYSQYEIKLREKFYSNKEGEVGIYQIINNINKLFDSEYKFDKGLNPLKVTIYPILVVHERSLNAIGLNGILNIWFDEQLELLRQKGYSANRVKKLVVIDIDTLIFFKQELKNTSIKLDVLLDTYLSKTKYVINARSKKKWSLQILLNTFIPFSNFIFGKFKDKKRNPTNLIIDIKKYL